MHLYQQCRCSHCPSGCLSKAERNIKHQLTLETSVSSKQPHARRRNKGALPEKTAKAFDNYLAKESCFKDLLQTNRQEPSTASRVCAGRHGHPGHNFHLGNVLHSGLLGCSVSIASTFVTALSHLFGDWWKDFFPSNVGYVINFKDL